MRIKSSSSNLIWNPNSIVNFGPIRNPTTKSSQRSRFQNNINIFWSKFDLFWLKDQYKDQKGWLKDWISQSKDRKGQFLSKSRFISKNLIKFDHFLLKSNYFWLKSIYIELFSIKMVRIQIKSSRRLNRTAGIRFKKID